MEIKYNDTFSTSHSSDDVFDFIEKDTTILKGSRNESASLPKSTEVNSNETLSSGYKPQSVQLDKPESPLVKGTVVEVKPILLSDPDVNTKAAFAKSHTRDFYKGRSFRYAGKWEKGVHYINDEYITDFVVKDGVLLVCKKSNMSSWSNEPTEWVYDGDQIISIISDYWEVVLVGGLRGKTYLPEYDEDSDSLVWRLVESEELPEEFQTYLGIKDYIDYSLVPVQEDIIDLQSDADITKRSVRALEGEVVDLGNGLTTLEVITGHISTHVEDLEGNFSDFVQTSEGFFYRVGDLENNVGQLWLTSQQFGVQMENAEGDIARLTIEADQISTRVENAEGDISQINQRADEISTQVENQQGDISRISQRADQIQSEVENQQGDISRITQRADVIESQVQNLDGDVSTISQRADQIQSQVENVEGDISTITQRADIIESQVQNQEGDISRISQTADQIQSQVENLNGDVSTITQRADEIQSQVENVEGDVSTVTQRANLIEAQVQNQAGDISRISQTADQIQSEVSNLEGDVSTVTQRADLIESQVQDVEGDVSTISQRADSIELEVLNQQGDISDIRQTADDINLRVENVEGDIATLDVRADQITSTVTDQQGQISQIRQTSTEIASEVAANKVDADNKYTETNSRITQTAAAINLEVARVEGKVDTNARTFTEALGNLQDQIDGAIDTWFYDYAPVHTDAQGVPDSQVPLNVVPYSDWVAAETVEEPEKVRDSHVSDIFYDQHSGYAYRFIGTGNPWSRVYTWVVIQDSAVIKALEDAARAQDTADNKRRVFVATPYAPYDLGDLWVKTTTVGNVAATELYRCIVAKTTAGTENIAADWAVADSYAKEVSKSNIQILADAIVQQTLTYTYDEYGRLTNETKSAITTGMNDISLAITGSKLETVGIFIRNADVNDNYINLIADKVRIKGTGDHTPTALGIYWDSTSQSYKISAANLQVEGAFSTTAWTDATTGQRKLVLDDAATAATGPTGYLTEALYGSGGSAASPTGGVYGTINPMTVALNNFTTITGGLILSTELILGQQSGQTWVPWAGMSGVYDARTEEHGGAIGHGIAAWYGGDCVDKAALTAAQIAEGWNIHRWAKTLFRMDGSGYLADRAIYWSDEGDLHLNTNIVLGDSSGDPTIDSILTFMARFGSWFVEDTTTMTGKTLLRINMGSQQGTGFDGLIFDGFLISGGDQIVISGTPGGGGGGAGWLYELGDVYGTTAVLRADGTEKQVGDVLQYYDSTKGWVAVASTAIGITTDATQSAHGLMSAADKTKLDYVGFGTAGSDYVPVYLGGSTPTNVLTAHQSLSAYATIASLGTMAYASTNDYFKCRGEISTDYVDLTTYTAGATGYQNPLNGIYIVNRTTHSDSLIAFTGVGSTSGLDILFSYERGNKLAVRRRVDSNRLSGAWENLMTDVNWASYIGTSSNYVGYASYATSSGCLNQSWFSNENDAMPGASKFGVYMGTSSATGADGHILAMNWTVDSQYGAQLFIDTDPTYNISLRQRDSGGNWTAWVPIITGANIGSQSVSYATSAGNADLLDGKHATDFSYKHQTSFDFNVGHDSNIVTFDQLNSAGAPTSDWYNGFVSAHSNYLSSYIINSHRTNNWYVGWYDSNQSIGLDWCMLYHSGNANNTNAAWQSSWLGTQYIRFQSGSTIHGYLYMNGVDGPLHRTNMNWDAVYQVWDSGNDGSGSGLDADLLDGRHLTQIPYLFNYSDLGGSSAVTVNDLANYYASTGMIYSATDNPTGNDNWIHVWSQTWSGEKNGWVSQIALGAGVGGGMWYRTSSSAAAGLAWKRVIDSDIIGSQSVSYATNSDTCDGYHGAFTSVSSYEYDGNVYYNWYKIESAYNSCDTYDIIVYGDANYNFHARYSLTISNYGNDSMSYNLACIHACESVHLYICADRFNVYIQANGAWLSALCVKCINGSDRFSTTRMGYAPAGTVTGFTPWTNVDVDVSAETIRSSGHQTTTQYLYCMQLYAKSGIYCVGNLTTTGDQVISSDITKKTNLVPITLTAEQIANAPAISFDWKDGHGHSFGSIAQYWKPLVPEAVLGKDGDYTLAYGQLGVVLGINNGKAIYKIEQHESEQDKEIRLLKEKVKKQAGEIRGLKKEIERLRMNWYGME